MRNEMMGFYRKQGQQEAALENAAAALELMEELEIGDSISGGTCYVNCGTVYDQFGMPEEALGYFEKARNIYEAAEYPDYGKLGGLYNNMGLALMDTGQFAKAGECFRQAVEVMSRVENGELETAITYLNMADAVSLEKGIDEAGEEITGYVEKAREMLDEPHLPRNGYYAFVCDRCAPGFYCYGYPEFGGILEERAQAIREDLNRE